MDCFTKRYRAHKLVYYEVTEDVLSALQREKSIKSMPRRDKVALVRSMNIEWRDLAEGL